MTIYIPESALILAKFGFLFGVACIGFFSVMLAIQAYCVKHGIDILIVGSSLNDDDNDYTHWNTWIFCNRCSVRRIVFSIKKKTTMNNSNFLFQQIELIMRYSSKELLRRYYTASKEYIESHFGKDGFLAWSTFCIIRSKDLPETVAVMPPLNEPFESPE